MTGKFISSTEVKREQMDEENRNPSVAIIVNDARATALAATLQCKANFAKSARSRHYITGGGVGGDHRHHGFGAARRSGAISPCGDSRVSMTVCIEEQYARGHLRSSTRDVPWHLISYRTAGAAPSKARFRRRAWGRHADLPFPRCAPGGATSTGRSAAKSHSPVPLQGFALFIFPEFGNGTVFHGRLLLHSEAIQSGYTDNVWALLTDTWPMFANSS
jgi:hypothetical protein